jgi:hypothetical protein
VPVENESSPIIPALDTGRMARTVHLFDAKSSEKSGDSEAQFWTISGQTRSKSLFMTFRSACAVERELRRRLRTLDTGEHVDPNRITVGKWLADWLATVRGEVAPKSYERNATRAAESPGRWLARRLAGVCRQVVMVPGLNRLRAKDIG